MVEFDLQVAPHSFAGHDNPRCLPAKNVAIPTEQLSSMRESHLGKPKWNLGRFCFGLSYHTQLWHKKSPSINILHPTIVNKHIGKFSMTNWWKTIQLFTHEMTKTKQTKKQIKHKREMCETSPLEAFLLLAF
jgi:hypothetical protein